MSTISGRPNPAEKVLLDFGIIKDLSLVQREILACIGCHCTRAEIAGEVPRFSTYDIAKCTLIAFSTVGDVARKLVEGDMIDAETESRAERWTRLEQAGRRPEVSGRPIDYYYPADTPEGEALFEVLGLPQRCPLAEEQID